VRQLSKQQQQQSQVGIGGGLARVVEYVPRAHILREFVVRTYEYDLDSSFIVRLWEVLNAPITLVRKLFFLAN
jgi:hypothetical protein